MMITYKTCKRIRGMSLLCKIKVLMFIFLSLNIHQVISDDIDILTSEEVAAAEQLELRLENGIEVILKANASEPNEVMLSATAVGGYASFPKELRASAELAPAIAWESGFSNVTPDQLSAYLYRHSIEINITNEPFRRLIQATTIRDELSNLLKLLKRYFTESQFHLTSYDTVKRLTK